MTYEELLELKEELENYANIEGTELGDYCLGLCSLVSYTNYLCSPEFKKILEEEMKSFLREFETRCEIVEKEETYKVKTLVWNEENVEI